MTLSQRKGALAAGPFLCLVILASAAAQLTEPPAAAVQVEEVCQTRDCLEAYRSDVAPVAVAVLARTVRFTETSLQARRTGSGKPFQTIATNTRDTPNGGAVIWHLRPSVMDLGPQVDIRVRVKPNGESAKNCPVVRLRSPEAPIWEFHDEDSGAWVESYLDNFAAVQITFPVPFKGAIACQ